MSFRRLLLFSTLATLAIAGGLFVSDRRTGMDATISPHPVSTGNALRLGLLMTNTPSSTDRNHIIANALFRLRDLVNQCGGVNQAPVFWAMITPTADTLTEATSLELLGIKKLLWQKRVHGAIAAFTSSPITHALYSDALNLAIESELPVISPVNTQFLVAQSGRFEQFRRNHFILTAQTKYWVRTIPSDRQQLAAVAQWLHQKDRTQIAILTPETSRGQHLEEVLGNAMTVWEQDAAEANLSVQYALQEREVEINEDNSNNADNLPDAIANPTEPQSSADDTPTDDSSTGNAATPQNSSEVAEQSAPEVQLTVEFSQDLAIWVEQPPEAVILMLEPDVSLSQVGELLEELGQFIDLEQVPVMIGNDVSSVWQQPTNQQAVLAAAYPAASIWGLTPHFQPEARRQLNQYGLSDETLLPPSVFYAWDGAALMMLAAESAASNSRQAIESELRMVANPPGVEVTDVCQGLDYIRQGQPINYRGVSSAVDLDSWGNVSPALKYDVWKITQKGDRQLMETFDFQAP